MKRIGIGLVIVLLIVLAVPSLVIYFSKEKPVAENVSVQQVPLPKTISNQIQIAVSRSESKKIETYPIEDYIVGVISAEMPAEFEEEALKAQALAARTYIVRRMLGKDFSDVPNGANVTDTIKHQVFIDDQQRHAAWGKDYNWKIQKVRKAVVDTQGQILTYDGKPIDATFFSVSNGYTENSEDYWGDKIPYLRSVAVPWDKKSPKYESQTVISLAELEKKLGVQLSAAASAPGVWSKVTEETAAQHVGKIKVGDKVFTGRQIREKLGLASTAFQWKLENGNVQITTFGSGHGVGMSQWGANGMAKDGKKAEDIVKYFYKGVAIEDYHQLLASK